MGFQNPSDQNIISLFTLTLKILYFPILTNVYSMQKNEKILYLQGKKKKQQIDYKIITIFLKRIKLIKNTKSFLKDKKILF